MHHVVSKLIWPLSIAALLVVGARYLHPATFADWVFPILVAAILCCIAITIVHKRYE